MSLDELRAGIDAADKQIIELLNARFRIVREVGEFKRSHGIQVYAPERESILMKRLCALNDGPMSSAALNAIYREIISASRALEQPLAIAFLGREATFTHQAALMRFGHSCRYTPQKTIGDIFEAVTRNQTAYGVVPVENSTEGAVTHTLDMFIDSPVKICAEINMAIHHNLLAACPIDELKVIYSHPQVFGQCRRWLQQNLPAASLVEVSSTTEAAERCAIEKHAGALASLLAAERYDLRVLEEHVQDSSDNVTRFLVLGQQEPEPTGDDKTSFLFTIRDRVGALYDSLQPLRKHEVNLTFIESRPSKRRSWDYFFFVDILGHISEDKIQQALDELSEHCQFVKILGSYPRAAEVC